ncbi:MAG: alanine dehydrogenase [Pseudomonadota bacterium]
MKIGLPKEIKPNEHRVGLTVESVRELRRHGHDVCVESGAGQGIGALDEDYKLAGAAIAPNASDVFEAANLIIKVKEPQPGETAMLNEKHVLFTYLHLAADPEQASALQASGCTAIAYETVTDNDGGLPLLTPMSEVAGRLSIQAAASCLEKQHMGRGLLMGGVPGVAPARVVIIGGGVVGLNAARMAVGIGAEVSILDRSLPRLRALDAIFQGRARLLYALNETVEREIRGADVVIGAVLIPGASAPQLVERRNLRDMKTGAVLVDIAIDQGGCFATSVPTTHDEPTFVVDEIVHYCVANMPGAVPRTSSYALNNATLPKVLSLASGGLQALRDGHLRAGLNVHRGKVTNEAVATSLGAEFTDAHAVGIAA